MGNFTIKKKFFKRLIFYCACKKQKKLKIVILNRECRIKEGQKYGLKSLKYVQGRK